MQKMKRVLAPALAVVLSVVSVVGPDMEAQAAKKAKLSAKKVSITVDKTKKVSVKNAKKGKVKWSIKNKKIASIKKSGKYAVKVKAKKKGKTTLTCKIKKNGKTTKLTCKITVSAKKSTKTTAPSSTAAPTPTANPGTSKPAGTSTPVTSSAPVITPTPVWTARPTIDPSRTAGPETLLQAGQKIFGNIGNCLTYNGGWGNKESQLQDPATMEYVKSEYNSFTLENEMKPDSILGGQPNLISVEEAKNLGYFIPDNYKDAEVPQLNFETVDAAMAVAKEYGLRMRAHTLLWHQQTPSWFFEEEYSRWGGEPATVDAMNARLEFYVRTVMDHFMDKEKELNGADGVGSIIYAWDVVNEYLHRTNAPTSLSWVSVYGDMGLEPSYVKDAFTYAYEELEKYGAENKVTLFNNDYDTYFVVEDTLKLIEFINRDKKVCGGIGMQSHLDVDRPTLEEYSQALDAFMGTGLEVQVTELDITINFDHEENFNYRDEGQTDVDQANFYGNYMDLLVFKQKNRDTRVSPKGITGVTIWGLYDTISWRDQMDPLLFGNGTDDPKLSYVAVMDVLLENK